MLFFYPKDFTFVCPTELHELQKRSDAFAERNVAIVGCSTDTEETHWAWLHVDAKQGGIRGVEYPLVADTSKTIATNYGVLGGTWYMDENDEMQFEGVPVAYRGTFLIDEQGVVRHMLINDLPLGRNLDELLRTIDMMHHVEEHGEVCPVNWHAGAKAFEPTVQGLVAYLQESPYEKEKGKCGKGCRCKGGKGGCQGKCGVNKDKGCSCGCKDCRCADKKPGKEKCPQCGCVETACQCNELAATEGRCAQCHLDFANCRCVHRHAAHIRCSQCGCKKGRCRCEMTNSI